MRHSAVWERSRPKTEEQASKGKRLSVKEVAEKLGCSKSSVYKLIDEGKLPAITLFESGKGLKVYESDLDRYLKAREEEAA